MAKRSKKEQEAKPVNKINVEDIAKIAEKLGITKEEVLHSLEDAISAAMGKNNNRDDGAYSDDKEIKDNRFVEIDPETGIITAFQKYTVVEEVENPELEISLEEAREEDEGFEIGDAYEKNITPTDFRDLGRVMAHHTKTMFIQKVTEKERQHIYEEYSNLIGTIVSARVDTVDETSYFDSKSGVQRKKRKYILSINDKVEAILKDSDCLPGDSFRSNQLVQVLISSVDNGEELAEKAQRDAKGRKRDIAGEPPIKCTRASEAFLKELMKKDVPEIKTGVVEIMAVSRKPGVRAKIAVLSHNPDVDPVTACVGDKGARIENVTTELQGEKIDVIRYSNDLVEFVKNALSPAKCSRAVASVDTETMSNGEERNVVYLRVPNDQQTLAIGNSGINVMLAAHLCGCRIDIKGIDSADTREHRDELADAFDTL